MALLIASVYNVFRRRLFFHPNCRSVQYAFYCFVKAEGGLKIAEVFLMPEILFDNKNIMCYNTRDDRE